MPADLTLRPAHSKDADYIAAAETVADIARFVMPWPAAEHLQRMTEPDFAYYVCEDRASGPVGYAILRGIGGPHRSIELMRLAVTERDRGAGSALLSLIAREAFDGLGANRLWLDVFPDNARARHVYRRFGFVEEGTLRESYLWNGAFRSTIVMSMLAREYSGPGPGPPRPD
ncbi:MAG: GNAT family N-acetyltransferase [Hyphomicrobiales bacterium]